MESQPEINRIMMGSRIDESLNNNDVQTCVTELMVEGQILFLKECNRALRLGAAVSTSEV